jgi:hypothetical protein
MLQSEDHEHDDLSEAQRSTVPPFGATHTRRRLATALAETLAITRHSKARPGSKHRHLWNQVAPDDPRLALTRALQSRHSTPEALDPDAELLDDLLLQAFLARLAADRSDRRLVHHWIADLEPEAQAAFRTGTFLIEHNPPGLDTGIAIAALGKALEVAANGTAIQGLRHAHGVTMPPYFRSHDPGRGAIPVRIRWWRGDGHVDLNERRARERWHALTLGQIDAVLAEDGARLPHLNDEVRELRALSTGLGPLRNQGVHVGAVEPELAQVYLERFVDQGRRGLFARLAEAVARLRS